MVVTGVSVAGEGCPQAQGRGGLQLCLGWSWTPPREEEVQKPRGASPPTGTSLWASGFTPENGAR